MPECPSLMRFYDRSNTIFEILSLMFAHTCMFSFYICARTDFVGFKEFGGVMTCTQNNYEISN